MKVYPVGFSFLQTLCEGYCEWAEDAAQADFVLTMNNLDSAVTAEARRIATAHGIPLCWWSIEDPNSCGAYGGNGFQQPMMADYVFTSDKACIPMYRMHARHEHVYWLPLAANEWLHKPLPLADDAADFVFSGNWYDARWQARRWGTEMVILPLARAGYSMAIFSYEEPPYPELKPFWCGGTSCYTTAEQYTHGRVVLGQNNQRSGMDGREHTYMTSMRTFEALACGKPFLAPWSEAYEALGFVNEEHLIVVNAPPDSRHCATDLADKVLYAYEPVISGDHLVFGIAMAERGRALVLANHTYGHRLRRIAAAIAGEAQPEDWRC